MQTVSATLQAAIEAPERPQALVRLRVDWARTGSYADAIDDLSADVVSVDLTRDLTTDLPAAAKLFAGAAAAEATVTLAHRDPAGDPAKHGAWFYSALNSASPLFSYRRKGAPAVLELGFVTATGLEYVTVLTGRVRSLQVSSGGRVAVMRISDSSEDMRKQVVLPMIIADGDIGEAAVIRPGLNTTFLADWTARKCGYYASPPPRSGCKFSATMHGSGYPEVGTIESHHGEFGSKLSYSPTPTFPTAAKWVQAVNTDGSAGQSMRYFLGGSGVISTNNTREVLLEGWFKLNSTGVDQPFFVLFDDTATTEPFISFWWQTSTGRLSCTFNRGGADNTNRTTGTAGPIVSPGTSSWHYYAMQASFTSTGVDVTFRFDGTTSGPFNVATPSVTGAPEILKVQVGRGRCSSYSDTLLDGLTEAVQATTESTTSNWNNAFVPTAQIVASSAIDNRLVATPTAAEEGWSLLQEIAKADFATTGFTESGLLFYWPRNRWTTAPYTTSQRTLTSSTALKELESVEATDQVRNRVIIRARIPEVTDSKTIWKLGGRKRIGASSSIVVWSRLAEPVGNVDTSVVYGTSLGSSRYLAGTRLDGTGSQVSNLTFDVEVISPTRIKSTITNPNGFTVYLAGDANASTTYDGKPYYWLDGQAVTFNTETTGGDEYAEAVDATSISDYGIEQLLEIEDSDFRQDSDSIQEIADALLVDLANPGPALSDMPAVGDPRIQLGDRLTIVDPEGLAMSADYHVSACNLSFDEGGLGMVLGLRSA
jgi:hypothetical protein